MEEVRRSLLIALIDRKITKYFTSFDGIVRKLEKGKTVPHYASEFPGVTEGAALYILEEVKTVNIGNEIAVTLSMGIGLNGATYQQNAEHSRIAMEMALGLAEIRL